MIKTQNAFTLLEMLVALSILMVLSAIAIPSLHSFWEKAEDGILQDQLLRAIDLAKMTAFTTHRPVTMCVSNALSALPTCSVEQADHLLVFFNENADGVVEDRGQIVALTQLRLQQGSLHWRSFPHYRQYLLMQPVGLLNHDNGTFWLCHAQSPAWAIFISKSARARVVYPDQHGDILDGKGNRLLCGK